MRSGLGPCHPIGSAHRRRQRVGFQDLHQQEGERAKHEAAKAEQKIWGKLAQHNRVPEGGLRRHPRGGWKSRMTARSLLRPL